MYLPLALRNIRALRALKVSAADILKILGTPLLKVVNVNVLTPMIYMTCNLWILERHVINTNCRTIIPALYSKLEYSINIEFSRQKVNMFAHNTNYIITSYYNQK